MTATGSLYVKSEPFGVLVFDKNITIEEATVMWNNRKRHTADVAHTWPYLHYANPHREMWVFEAEVLHKTAPRPA